MGLRTKRDAQTDRLDVTLAAIQRELQASHLDRAAELVGELRHQFYTWLLDEQEWERSVIARELTARRVDDARN